MDLKEHTELHWVNSETLRSRSFICGHCGLPLASEHGWWAYAEGDRRKEHIADIYVCHNCSQPSYFGPSGQQTPGVAYGNPVHDIPNESVESLYEEARNCTAANAFTAAVLCCRKLLMNIAVSKSAPEGKRFI